MKLPGPPPFGFAPPTDWGKLFKFLFCALLELGVGTLFYTIYASVIDLMGGTYLAELPILGLLFGWISPDATASHLIAALLAVFSISTPIILFSECLKQEIFSNAQEWFSHAQNKVLAGISISVLLMVIALEVICLRVMIMRQSEDQQTTAFGIQQSQQNVVLDTIAQDSGLAIGVSIVIAIVNLLIAFFTIRAFHNLKTEEA